MRHSIIPVFIPHQGCPHRCVFCDQRTITGVDRPPGGAEVAALIGERLAEPRRAATWEIAFYGGSFTCLPAAWQEELLAPAKAALDRGQINAIRLSTRPDAIDRETLARLAAFGVSTVELGAQSLDDRVLAAAARGHTAGHTAAAVAAIKDAGLKCGLQLMPGLPGEDWISLIATTKQVLALAPDFIRIYPAVVLAGTELAAMAAAGAYRPLTLGAAVARAAYLKNRCENNGIPAIRVGLQASEELSGGAVLAGPYHPAFGAMTEAYLFRIMVAGLLEKIGRPPGEMLIRHHPRDASVVRGISNANLLYWEKTYRLAGCRLAADWPRRGEIAVFHRNLTYILNKAMLFST
ncbi:elongator complex protein 3 [Anaeroselena agilis]|uniref:Radical SAM protein n=1 Tax=Anaeroselena agilis TaxID=3063788 RepID=A0ABU3NWQ2_9FIRM|nr:radical SAM protein [Selenomonadales bacterium 4137-cl]